MSMTSESRRLSDRERAVLSHILATTQVAGAGELLAQVPAARVCGGIPTFLDFEVVGEVPRSSCADGPLPGDYLVVDREGEMLGEILVWVTDGYLSGLEYAWVTDEMPTEMPLPEHIRLE